jgi:hypothetical protein
MTNRRKKLDDEYEEVLASGEPGKKGIKYAKEHFKNEEKKNQEKEDLVKNFLQDQAKRSGYNRFLSDLLLDSLNQVDWPKGWSFQVAPDKIGVIMEIKTDTGRFFRTAFRSTKNGYYDYNAVNNFVERVWRLIDQQDKPLGIPEEKN